MGNFGSKKKLKHHSIIMMGFEGSGSSYMLYKMRNEEYLAGTKHEDIQIIQESHGSNDVEIWEFASKKLWIRIWRKNPRITYHDELWKKYCKDVEGLFFMIPSGCNKEEYDLFHKTLWHLGAENRDIPILLFCDKYKHPCSYSTETIQNIIGFYKELFFDEHELMQLRQNSMMKCLPNDIFDIIIEYVKESCNGISVKWNAEILMDGDIELIDRYKDKDNFKRVLDVVCEYLPRYNYNDKPAEQYIISW